MRRLLWSNEHTKENTNSSNKRLSEFHICLGFQDRLWRASSLYKVWTKKEPGASMRSWWLKHNWSNWLFWTGTGKEHLLNVYFITRHIKKSRNNIACNPYPNPVSQIFFKSKFAIQGYQGLRKSNSQNKLQNWYSNELKFTLSTDREAWTSRGQNGDRNVHGLQNKPVTNGCIILGTNVENGLDDNLFGKEISVVVKGLSILQWLAEETEDDAGSDNKYMEWWGPSKL